jgi:hypothetical protein
VRRAGLCCTARASRPASAVGVSSNVRPHTAGLGSRSTSVFHDARRGQIHVSGPARFGRRPAEEPHTSERHQPLHRIQSTNTSFMLALRGIRSLLAGRSRQPGRRLAAKRSSLPFGQLVRGGEEWHHTLSQAALRLLPKARHSSLAASGVRPNPSLSRDPTRQAAWAARRLGLCCTAPPKRLAARVAVSSNVRQHEQGRRRATTPLAASAAKTRALAASSRLLRPAQPHARASLFRSSSRPV